MNNQIFKSFKQDELMNLAIDSVSIILPEVRTAPIAKIEEAVDQILLMDHFASLNKRAVFSGTLQRYLNIPPAILALNLYVKGYQRN